MQIQLKQNEIELAIKQFITRQGIDLTNQSVGISFTAGRKNGGLLADVTINDMGDIPGLDDAAPEVVKPVLSVVAPPAPEPEVAAAPAVDNTPPADVPADAAPKAPTASLFG